MSSWRQTDWITIDCICFRFSEEEGDEKTKTTSEIHQQGTVDGIIFGTLCRFGLTNIITENELSYVYYRIQWSTLEGITSCIIQSLV